MVVCKRHLYFHNIGSSDLPHVCELGVSEGDAWGGRGRRRRGRGRRSSDGGGSFEISRDYPPSWTTALHSLCRKYMYIPWYMHTQ